VTLLTFGYGLLFLFLSPMFYPTTIPSTLTEGKKKYVVCLHQCLTPEESKCENRKANRKKKERHQTKKSENIGHEDSTQTEPTPRRTRDE
jgi:hypothetical protein